MNLQIWCLHCLLLIACFYVWLLIMCLVFVFMMAAYLAAPDHFLECGLEVLHGLSDTSLEGVVTDDLATGDTAGDTSDGLLREVSGVESEINSQILATGLLALGRDQRGGVAEGTLDDAGILLKALDGDLLLVEGKSTLGDQLGVDILGLVGVLADGGEAVEDIRSQGAVVLIAHSHLLHEGGTLLGGDGHLALGVGLLGELGDVFHDLCLLVLDNAQLLDVGVLLGLEADLGALVLRLGGDERGHLGNLNVSHDGIG